MTTALSIFLKSFVRAFYRANAGTFVFLLTIMFGVVGRLDGASIVDYHYSLISGAFANAIFFGLVLFCWLLYAGKCSAFVVRTIRQHEFSFLNILVLKGRRYVFGLFVIVQVLLYAPIWTYALLMAGVAMAHHWWGAAATVIAFLAVVIMASAARYTAVLHNTGKTYWRPPAVPVVTRLKSSYVAILLRYVLNNHPLMFAATKLYTCGMTFLMLENNTASRYDAMFPMIFFSFGIFAHAMIIYRLRQFEETRMLFYRGFPVSAVSRLLQYIGFYAIIFVPELLTLIRLTPVHLHVGDAVDFALSGFSILLLLHGLTYTVYFTMKDLMKISLLLFAVVFLFSAKPFFAGIYLLFLPIALLAFFIGYPRYQHEK
jgi:hypothetical protein